MTTRRRFLTILAGAAVLPGFAGQASAAVTRWRGVALGANAQIILDHPDADALIAQAVGEIHRLERIFSLYQSNSQISRLNRDGVLDDPAFELIELLSLCSTLNARTRGAFDPTVQRLWALYAEEISGGSRPDQGQIADTLNSTGWHHIRFSTEQVAFTAPGVQVTLNGIAQGYIADKVTDIFRGAGVTDVLINTGEVSALGAAPDGNDWQIRLGDTEGAPIELRNSAVATSAPLGTTFDENGLVGHIIDPRTGLYGGKWQQVSVIAKTAAEADGLSTGFCLMDRAEIQASLGDTKVVLT